MTLLPIIYTSLILFFGILLFVIAVSYLIFKTRRRTNPVIEEEIKKHKNHLNIVKHNIHSIKDYSNANTQNVINSKSYQNTDQNFADVQILPMNYFSGIQQSKNQNNYNNHNNGFDKNFSSDNRKKEAKVNYVTKSSLLNSRIEIMNDSKKFRSNRNTYIDDKPIKKYQFVLPEYNLLDFYSDNHGNDLISITASQNRSV